MTKDSDSNKKLSKLPKNEFLIENPAVVPIIFHEKKSQLLKILLEKEMTIMDLKNETKMNPGTIKRHLDDLLKYNLIFISRSETNEYGMVMKYYRAVAKTYKISLSWPS